VQCSIFAGIQESLIDKPPPTPPGPPRRDFSSWGGRSPELLKAAAEHYRDCDFARGMTALDNPPPVLPAGTNPSAGGQLPGAVPSEILRGTKTARIGDLIEGWAQKLCPCLGVI
jgi:hypothetical protein